jgi:hypothetical protein
VTIDPETIADLADLLGHLREHHGLTTAELAHYSTLEDLRALDASFGGCE